MRQFDYGAGDLDSCLCLLQGNVIPAATRLTATVTSRIAQVDQVGLRCGHSRQQAWPEDPEQLFLCPEVAPAPSERLPYRFIRVCVIEVFVDQYRHRQLCGGSGVEYGPPTLTCPQE